MTKYNFAQSAKTIKIDKLLDGKPKRFNVVKDQVAEVEDLSRIPDDYFGKDVRLIDCPLCWGTGIVGDVDGMTTQGAEAHHFGGGNFRECHVCKGSGKLLQDMWLRSDALIRIVDNSMASVESKIRIIKRRGR